MNKIFISYSHEDKKWKKYIIKFLNEVTENFEIWDDQNIRAGKKWNTEILSALHESSIVLLLISIDYLTSEFIKKTELPEILEHQKNSGCKIIPILVRHCFWQRYSWISEIQLLPKGAVALNKFRGHELEWHLTEIAKEMRIIIEELKKDQKKPNKSESNEIQIQNRVEDFTVNEPQPVENESSKDVKNFQTGFRHDNPLEVEFININGSNFKFGLNEIRVKKLINVLYEENELTNFTFDELEQHQKSLMNQFPCINVNLQDFQISRDPITNGQFRQFMRESGYICDHGDPCPDNNQFDNFPVTKVTWNDVQAFCHYTGYRLPTLQEWHFAASGGDDRMYPWGDDYNSSYLNDINGYLNKLSPVSSYEEGNSRFGLRQMAGNIFEFIDAGTTDEEDIAKATIGGSYKSYGRQYASIYHVIYHVQHNDIKKNTVDNDLGFRVCKSRDLSYKRKWRNVHAGHFIQGCKPEFAEYLIEEFNLSRSSLDVLLSFSYQENYLDQFEISEFFVTNEEYYEFVKKTGYKYPSTWRKNNIFGPFYNQEKYYPVTGILFEDAVAYCNWANLGLANEMQWEKAARGENGNHYPWGDTFDISFCNTNEMNLGRSSGPFEFPQSCSPFHILDMCGNVYDYVVDSTTSYYIQKRGGSFGSTCQIYGTSFYGIKADISLPADKTTGFRVIRL
jgi:formylglycine-generating enzyme required for sulfatase activity